MLKKILTMFSFALMFAMITGITACSNDDDDLGDVSKVVGTWIADDYDHFYSNISITFNADGSGSFSMEHMGNFISVYRGTFTYKVKDNKVITDGVVGIANSDGESSTRSFSNTLEIRGNSLTVVSDSWMYNFLKSLKKS